MASALNDRLAITDISERVALGASAACVVHCLVLPLILVLLPSLSAVLAIPESFHLWAIGLAIPSATLALGMGWRSHRVILPLLAGMAGLVLLMIGALVVGETDLETPLTVAGSLTLAAAHLSNWRLRHPVGCTCDC